MTSRLPRWAVLLFLPLMAGSLLLMHGLEAGASDGVGHSANESAHSHEGESHPGRADDSTGSCRGCLAHLVMTCVAVIMAVTTWHFSRRRYLPPTGADRVAGWRVRPHVGVLRARDPVWVQLSVMTC